MKHLPRTGVLDFTGMMALLIESGLSLRDALEVFASADKQSPAGRLGNELSRLIRRGVSFAGAVASMEDTFPPMYRGMVRVGDRVGSVERIFPRLSEYLLGQKQLREKIAAALTYPLFVLALAVLGTLGLVFCVMPRLETIFGGFGGEQAARIQANIRVIKALLLCFACGIAAPALALAGLKLFGKAGTASGGATGGALCGRNLLLDRVDRLLLKLPLAGGFIAAWESLNFSFAMEVLAGGGVPVEAALREASAVLGNAACRHGLERIRERVINGGSLSGAFMREGIFPPYMERWLAVGERSGQTERVFAQIRAYFQEEINQRTSRLLLLIEPALIAVIGAVILGLVAGIVLPLFSMYGSII
ncbi:MAG: type II secretion system F family protein [Treponema sp.]|jgi:type II secretory pathway component PulF|nr:type II secretion system F family protein [Treponema sp.]